MNRTPPLWILAATLATATAAAPAMVTAQTVPTSAVDATPSSPESVLDSILTTPPTSRAHWGVAVYDLVTGDPVLLHNPDRLFTPASTMKLVTATAALDLLGPEYRFETSVEATIDGDGRTDRLVVHGGGDPSLATPFYDDPLAPLDSLADSLAAAGLRHVAGPLIIDQSRFDSVRVHPAWENFDLDWYYAAPVAPFSVMESAWEVVMTPGAVGEPATVDVPHGRELLGLDARVRTVPGHERWDDVLRRFPDADSLLLRGTIGAGVGPDTSWIAQTRPGRTAGRAFRAALERAGIVVDGPVEATNNQQPTTTAQPEGEREVRAVWRSPPLEAIIHVALERSDNWITEQVLKTLAATMLGQGDWSGGTNLVQQYLTERVGVPEGAVYMRDGSGLTPQGLLTPDAVVQVLRHAASRPWSPAFREALARPGETGSTLEDRLLQYKDRVLGKTGTLSHVNALSGYLTTRNGRTLVFSILNNGSNRPSWETQPALDRIVESLLESGS